MPDRLFSTYQVANMLGVTPGTVAQWMKRDMLAHTRLAEGAIRISQKHLAEFLKGRGVDVEEVMSKAAARTPEKPAKADLVDVAPERPGQLETAPVAEADEQAPDAPAEDPLAEDESAEPPPSWVSAAQRRAEAEAEAEAERKEFDIGEIEAEIAELSEGESLSTQTAVTADQGNRSNDGPRIMSKETSESPPSSAEPADPPEPAELVEPAPAAGPIDEIAKTILSEAITRAASSVHLQAGNTGTSLAMRIDGVVQRHDVLSEKLSAGQVDELILHFKSRAGVDVSGPSTGWCGSLAVDHDGRQIQLTVTGLPIVGGQRLTIRLLDAARPAPTLDSLGLGEVQAVELRRLLAGQAGLVLVAGPDRMATAKLVTALAGELLSPGADVIYLSRRAECRIDGLTVSRVDPKSGFGFAEAAVAAAGSDADALCIGELADPPTALAAFDAAECGTPVLAGLVAPTLAEVFALFSEMGLAGWPLSMCLKGIVLCAGARRLCENCKAQADPAEAVSTLGIPVDRLSGKLFAPAGCDRCGSTGYAGRMMLAAAVPMSLPIKQALRSGAEPDQIQAAAVVAGATTLKQAALAAVQSGQTGASELARILPG